MVHHSSAPPIKTKHLNKCLEIMSDFGSIRIINLRVTVLTVNQYIRKKSLTVCKLPVKSKEFNVCKLSKEEDFVSNLL